MSTDAARELLDLLHLEDLDVDLFRGRQPESTRQRVYGGQVAAQALIAAARTVDEDFHVHSLHSYFLLPGDYSVPIIYDVERIRDGRSFATGGEDGYVRITHFPEDYFDAFSKKSAEAFGRPWPEKK